MRVYLDNNATTPLDQEVKQAIIETLDLYGNPSSHHTLGRVARDKMEEARSNIAEFINASPEEIVFTSGGSESNNIVMRSMLCGQKCCPEANTSSIRKFITSGIEHPSIIETARHLECEGVETVYLPVDKYGVVDVDFFRNEAAKRADLVSIMYANNEIGTIQPIKELAAIAHENGLLFHTDAIQAPTKIPIDVKELNVDYLSLSGHKMYAPKGVGILYAKKGTKVCPLISGGHQETGLRAGTENTIGIIAMGKAAEIAMRDGDKEIEKVRFLRDKLEKAMLAKIPKSFVNGHPTLRVPNTLNISFSFIEGESILYMLDNVGIEVSTGSACSSGSLDPSHVLVATGTCIEHTHSSIRISLGKYNTEAEIDYVIEQFPPIIERLRKMSPFS